MHQIRSHRTSTVHFTWRPSTPEFGIKVFDYYMLQPLNCAVAPAGALRLTHLPAHPDLVTCCIGPAGVFQWSAALVVWTVLS